MDIESRAVHAAKSERAPFGAIVDPLVMSTTFECPSSSDYESRYSYSRLGNPNRAALEQIIANLEGGSHSFAFASGSAAASVMFQALNPGDHVIAPRDSYYGVRAILEQIFVRWGLSVTFVDMLDLVAVKHAVRPSTRMIWMETPSNPLLRVSNIGEICEIARKSNAVTVVDNTVATPVLQNPFVFGCDFVVHSTTKGIAGHSDATAGIVVARSQTDLSERVSLIQTKCGAVPSPFDCWLTLRGIRTMPIRMRSGSQTALAIARFLAEHPRVEVCHYPGLENYPQHALAKYQMIGGFGALLSFQVAGDKKTAIAVKNRLQLITRATSLGGVESLIEHRASVEPAGTQTPENLLRLSVGLESLDDLRADLESALAE